MKRRDKRSEFRFCPQLHPEFRCACVRINGHEMELGGHTDGRGVWWNDSLPCSLEHKYRRGVVCTRPRGHSGPHEAGAVRWSK